MALIKSEDSRTHINFDYKIPSIRNRKEAMLWGIEKSESKIFKVLSIELDDFESFHDGTISTQMPYIDNKNDFIVQYLNSGIKCFSIIGEYKDNPFVLSISLNSGIIGLACRKSKMVDYKELERLLGLI